MKCVSESEPYLQQALNEHHELHQHVTEIGAALEADPTEVSQQQWELLRGRLVALRQRLFAHFQQEEEGGYLEEAICRAPTMANAAAQLQKQHCEFLSELAAAIEAPQGKRKASEMWLETRERFGQLAKRLLAHEQAENVLLGRAFNVDLSTE